MGEHYTRESVLSLLREKQESLSSASEDRFPKRSDFSDDEVCAIKAFLGPWPRALEAAGLKPPRGSEYAERLKEKRIRQKRRRTAFLIASKTGTFSESAPFGANDQQSKENPS